MLLKQRNPNRLIVKSGEEKEGGREKTKTQTMRMMTSLRIQRVSWMRMRTSRETGRKEQSSER